MAMLAGGVRARTFAVIVGAGIALCALALPSAEAADVSTIGGSPSQVVASAQAIRVGIPQRTSGNNNASAGGAISSQNVIASTSANASPAPQVIQNAAGITDVWAPPDWNNAVSPSRYIQIINNRVGFYSFTTVLKLISTDTTFNLTTTPDIYLSDPSVDFDPSSQRFYYVLMDQDGAGNWYLDWGFSRTNAPSSVADFCHYRFATGTTMPDFPKLGGTTNFLLIGVNNGTAPSPVYWARKPKASPLKSCPASMTQGQTSVNINPVMPMRLVDPSTTTYLLQNNYSDYSSMDAISVSESQGQLTFGPIRSIPIGAWSPPTLVPQPLTADGIGPVTILTNGIQAWDPAYKREVVWTTREVNAGAGAAVQWYELDPATAVVLQGGQISDPNLYLFNAAISPDREYVSAKHNGFGSNMVITFNSSSSTSYLATWVASMRSGMSLSPSVRVSQSSAAIHACSSYHICRWGDYAGASPAVGASLSRTTGRVWLTNGTIDPFSRYGSVNLQVAP